MRTKGLLLLPVTIVLLATFVGNDQSWATGEHTNPPTMLATPVRVPQSPQVETYEEDFSSYLYKSYTDRAHWDIFGRSLSILPSSGGAHRESFVAPDGHGGAYVTWNDLRNNHSNGNWDIYAQRVDSYGNRLWSADLRVNSDITETYQGVSVIAVDSQGNALIAWTDDREADAKGVYIQKISPNGAKLWSADVRVNSRSSFRSGWGVGSLAMAIDGQDNVVLAWQGVWENNWADPDIHAQKISPNGERLWAEDVKVNADVGHRQTSVALGVGVQGDVVAAWVDERNGGQDLFVQRLDPAGNRLWAEDVQVSAGSAVQNQGNPNVVTDSQGNAVIVWRSGPEDPPLNDTSGAIYAQKLDVSGALLWSGNAQVNVDTTAVFRGHPKATLAVGDNVLVVWEDARRGFDLGTVDLYSQLLSPEGTRVWSSDVRVNPETWENWNLKPGVGVEDDLAWVSWETDDDVHVQVLNLSSVSPVLPIPVKVNEGDGKVDQIDPDIALLENNELLVAWHDVHTSNWDIYAQVMDLDGHKTWPVGIQVNNPNVLMKRQRLQVAANAGNLSLIVWQDEQGGIYGQLIDDHGFALWGDGRRIDSHHLRAYNPAVTALVDGSFVVAWVEERESGSDFWDVYFQRLDTQGNRLWTNDLRVNTGDYRLGEVDIRSKPEIAVDTTGHLVVVWRGDTGSVVDVFARRFSPEGNPDWAQDLPIDAHLYTLPGRFQDRVQDVIADDEITIVTVSFRNGMYGLYARRFDLDGNVVWNPGVWVACAPQKMFYGNPDLALTDNGDTVVTWDEEPGVRDAFAQRLSRNGEVIWPAKVRLNEYLAWPLRPALSAGADGSFIAVWNDERYGDNSIYAQRFTADGNLLWHGDLVLIAGESFYYPTAMVESRTVDNTSQNIPRASLLVSQTLNGGSVTFYLSNDGGQTWEKAVPGDLHTFSSMGSDLRWKAVLQSRRDRLQSPLIESLTIRYGPDVVGDAYEPDDICVQAQTIRANGLPQKHIFHDYADTDWIVFGVVSGTTYLIEAQVPTGSRADMVVELHSRCGGLPLVSQNYAFTPNILVEYRAQTNGSIYLKLFSHNPAVYGLDVSYHISVRALVMAPAPGALVLVAGRRDIGDPLQGNIHHVTDAVYQLFVAHGYDSNRIYYLATDLGLEGVDALSTVDNLRSAIIEWAPSIVGPDRPFTLYSVDHGNHNKFYLDRSRGEWVTPQDVDNWLTYLEAAVPGVKINVVIEACYSGSFIDLPLTISSPGRVVMSSTGAWNLAWASTDGAVFSDHFTEALGQERSLYASFQAARWAAGAANPSQTPWLDDDGDGRANEAEDGEEAAQRGFAYPGTLDVNVWPPYVVQGVGPTKVVQGQGSIQAEVRDDERVRRVWAVIYPPSYRPPETGDEMVRETLPTIVLQSQGNDWYGAIYPGFNEMGLYRVVIYAEDDEGREARPLTIEVRTGWAVYLPLVVKSYVTGH